MDAIRNNEAIFACAWNGRCCVVAAHKNLSKVSIHIVHYVIDYEMLLLFVLLL